MKGSRLWQFQYDVVRRGIPSARPRDLSRSSIMLFETRPRRAPDALRRDPNGAQEGLVSEKMLLRSNSFGTAGGMVGV